MTKRMCKYRQNTKIAMLKTLGSDLGCFACMLLPSICCLCLGIELLGTGYLGTVTTRMTYGYCLDHGIFMMV